MQGQGQLCRSFKRQDLAQGTQALRGADDQGWQEVWRPASEEWLRSEDRSQNESVGADLCPLTSDPWIGATMTTANNSGRGLDTIQRWMQAAIMHPVGVAEGIASAEARAYIDVGPEEAETVRTRSRAWTTLDRLAISSYAYYARLLQCIREEFPVLKHALGEEVFDAFAVGYLLQYPSRSYTLFQLGANFPRYLAETRPDAS